MEVFLLLFTAMTAGAALVMFFYPEVAFRPIDDDVAPGAVRQQRWFMLGLFFMMLSQSLSLAARMAEVPEAIGLTLMSVTMAAGVASMAWGFRGSRRLRQERLRLMRERHAAELRELTERHNQPAD